MADDKKVDKNKLPEPTFEKQVSGYDGIDGSDPIFSHAYQKYLIELLKARDKSNRNVLIAEVKNQNSEFSAKLLSDVNEVIEKQWIRVLDEKLKEQSLQLNSVIGDIQKDITYLRNRNSTKWYIIRGAIYIAIALFIAFIGLMFLFPWYNAHFAEYLKDKPSSGWIQNLHEKQEHNSGVTRNINYDQLTTVQSDSLHTQNQENILRTIEANNKK